MRCLRAPIRDISPFACRLARTGSRLICAGWGSNGTRSANLAIIPGPIEQLKAIGRLYPCFETETELRAKREYRIRRGQPDVYDRAMLKLTPEQREAAEAGGKRPYWRFRLTNRVLIWNDAISGRREAKLTAISDPILVAADGTPAAALTAVVDDVCRPHHPCDTRR